MFYITRSTLIKKQSLPDDLDMAEWEVLTYDPTDNCLVVNSTTLGRSITPHEQTRIHEHASCKAEARQCELCADWVELQTP
jgi:hypothetical protein